MGFNKYWYPTIAGIVALVFVIASNSNNVLLAKNNSKFSSNEAEAAYKEYAEKKLDETFSIITSDISDSFNINESDYKIFRITEFKRENTNFSTDEYAKFRLALSQNVFNGKDKKIQKGDFMPAIYLKKDGSQILVAFKSKEGKNYLYVFNKIENDWRVDEIKEKNGKKVEKVKLLKPEEFEAKNFSK
ncbi:hypothetical protein G3578_14735 [Brevibacillus sp. SYP-B805]|uniref:hypothetical protein n=1 Tax=Brevibacillus sp. SYP-B805 TaxID=1578199 RepID=UPI0013ECBED7|nr:hypothetical protein [Brevibacillus sp. SYP-B805]NGQ96417.1 hypothetical protein [Brevibacillus sp. SYP-B805]